MAQLGANQAACTQYGIQPDYNGYMRSVRALSDVAMAIPEDEQRSFVASFDRLPQAVQMACMSEALSPAPHATPTSDATIAIFAAEPEGAVLVREWGHLTPRNHARCRERVTNILWYLDQQSRSLANAFSDWLFETLTVGQRTALFRKMAA